MLVGFVFILYPSPINSEHSPVPNVSIIFCNCDFSSSFVKFNVFVTNSLYFDICSLISFNLFVISKSL